MALKYGKKVCVDGFYGGIVRVIRDENEVITHVDVEVSGVIDRYSISQVTPMKQLNSHERVM